LLFNPDFVNKLTKPELLGLLAHETMHNAAKHFARRGGRDARKFNVACDLAINGLLKEAGFTLPKGGCFPGEDQFAHMPPNLAAEEYFARLPHQPEGDDGDGSGAAQPGNDPGGCGAVIDPEDPEGTPADTAAQAQLEAEWSVNVAAAQQAAQRRGTMSAGLDRFCGEALAPKADWKAELREFITRPAKANYSWKRPSRRHLWSGLFLPSLHSLEIGQVVVAVDTSGSIDQETIRQFAGEIEDVAAQGAAEIKIVFHDSDVCHVQKWNPSQDGPLCLESKGGGGTSHKFLPKWIEDNCDEPPAVLICLTDAHTEYPTTEPICPTLWAVIGNKQAAPPFGEVIHLH
jgi:predicted metal-dependent peptidase